MRRGLIGAVFVGATLAHNAARMLRLRDVANEHDHDLEHDGRVGGHGGPPVRLAILGDSAAAGFGIDHPDLAYPRLLARRLADRTGRPVEVRCLARRGVRVAQVTDQQVPALGPLRPHVVAVAAGANDVLGRVPPHVLARHTRTLIGRIRDEAPDAVVFIGPPARFGDAPALPAPTRWVLDAVSHVARQVMTRVAEEEDVATGMLPRLAAEDFGPDGFHGGEPAHVLAADITVDSVGPVLRKRPRLLERGIGSG